MRAKVAADDAPCISLDGDFALFQLMLEGFDVSVRGLGRLLGAYGCFRIFISCDAAFLVFVNGGT